MKNLFKSSLKNIIDGVVTSIIGTTVMVMTVIMLWTNSISFRWDGVLGIIVGALLLIAPKDIPGLIKTFIKSKGSSNDDCPKPVDGEGNQKP